MVRLTSIQAASRRPRPAGEYSTESSVPRLYKRRQDMTERGQDWAAVKDSRSRHPRLPPFRKVRERVVHPHSICDLDLHSEWVGHPPL